MYTVYSLGKRPYRPKSHVTPKCSWALTWGTTVYEIISEMRPSLLLRTPIATLRMTGMKQFNSMYITGKHVHVHHYQVIREGLLPQHYCSLTTDEGRATLTGTSL